MPDLSNRDLMWQRVGCIAVNKGRSYINKMGPRRANEESSVGAGNEHPGSCGASLGAKIHVRSLRDIARSSRGQSVGQYRHQHQESPPPRPRQDVQDKQHSEQTVIIVNRPTEHRTLVCTSLSKEIQVKLHQIEVLSNNLANNQREACHEASRRRQLLAGGSVLMEHEEGGGATSPELDEGTAEELEFCELEEHVWLLMWLVLGPQRLQHLSISAKEEDGLSMAWDSGGARLVWRALQLCCSARGAKSASAVQLAEDHDCDIACLRDHASRLLEVCAPTRELWRAFGWAGLTVDAVLRKVLREDVLPHIALLPSVPEEVTASLRRIETWQAALKTISAIRSRHVPEQGERDGPEVLSTDASFSGLARRKRGRPAKSPATNRREPGRLERVFLWRFLLELLEDSRLGACLRWVQRDEGIFRILNTDMLARLWGRRHGNPRMTYEKMARAMRTYYRSRVLLPVPRARNLPRKLVYRFSPTVLQKVTGDSHVRSNVTMAAARSVPGNAGQHSLS